MGDVAALAAELTALRTGLGLSREEVAVRVGVDPQTVTSWELGYRRIKLGRAYAFAAALGVRPVLVPVAGPVVELAACPELGGHVGAAGRLPVVRQLRATRRLREVPRTVLAARLGLRVGTVSGWESGRRAMYVSHAHAYAEVVGAALTLEAVSDSVQALVEAGARPAPYAGGR